MNAQNKEASFMGDIRKEFLEIEKFGKSEAKDNVNKADFTKVTGGVLTLICC